MSRWQAFRASTGMVNTGSQSGLQLARAGGDYMRSTAGLNRAARVFDWTSVSAGAAMTAVSARDMAALGGEMSDFDKAHPIIGLGTGMLGTGLGARGLVTSRPPKTDAARVSIADESGRPVDAKVYGTPPKTSDHVYVPPKDGAPMRGDEPELAGKTHIFIRNAENREAVVLPWMRGASSNHRSTGAEPLTGREIAHTDGPHGDINGSSQRALEIYCRANGLNLRDYRWSRQNGQHGQPDTAVLRRREARPNLQKLEVVRLPGQPSVVQPKTRTNPLNRRVGDAAEEHAIAEAKNKGYTTILTVKNRSGHGVDLVMYNPVTRSANRRKDASGTVGERVTRGHPLLGYSL